ncbi:MAG: hypothetical protein F7B20_06675 [Aeropyrum sp.]|nr:hypothetical protein [Aeropyrum sp.]MCE4616040.1 hypothetical protein [Aeropyrum sp.]
MPRFDRGFKLLEISRILGGLSEDDRRLLVEWALGGQVYAVTSPSVAAVRLGFSTVLVAVGVGSLISREEPPLGSYYELARSEWIDACPSGGEPRAGFLEGDGKTVEGTVVAYAFRDPVASLVNGLGGEHVIVESSQALDDYEVFASLEGGQPVLLGGWDGYLVAVSGGPAYDRLALAAPILSSCI